jgi:hypothetical protein
MKKSERCGFSIHWDAERPIVFNIRYYDHTGSVFVAGSDNADRESLNRARKLVRLANKAMKEKV